MARFLFVTFSTPDQLHPFIGPAQQLTRMGHEVHFCSNVVLGARLATAGLHAQSFSLSPEVVGSSDDPGRIGQMSDVYAKRRHRLMWYRFSLLSRLGAEVAALRAIVRETQPDAMCVNPIFYAGGIVGAAENIPWACLSPTLLRVTPPGWTSPFIEGSAIDTLEEVGKELLRMPECKDLDLHVERGCLISPWLEMVCTVEQFAPRVGESAHLHYVGTSVQQGRRGDEPVFDWTGLPTQGIVYVTGGTQAGFSLDQFATMAEAFRGDTRTVVMAIFQPTTTAFLAALPPNVRVFSYVPQDEMIHRSAVVISHGGANTIADCLRQGVPSLVIPRGHDQYLQAHLIGNSRAGRVLDSADLAADRCRADVEGMLAEDSVERRRARELSAALSATEGSHRIAELLTRLAGERQPLPHDQKHDQERSFQL